MTKRKLVFVAIGIMATLAIALMPVVLELTNESPDDFADAQARVVGGKSFRRTIAAGETATFLFVRFTMSDTGIWVEATLPEGRADLGTCGYFQFFPSWQRMQWRTGDVRCSRMSTREALESVLAN